MVDTVFAELKFWLLVLGSVLAPCGIYLFLLLKRAISRGSVALFGMALVVLSSLDVYLLQALETRAKLTHSMIDDSIFVSEVSVALYLLPLLFAGVGIHLVSHVLITHLADAEKRYQSSRDGG
jgi:hypothetical protein